MNDPLGAFCTHCDVSMKGARGGPLYGLTFAAKDNFDVAGFCCCAGNPDWLRTHCPADSTAPAIELLLGAGANLIGKTVLDELAYSLSGDNAHYGMPINPRAPQRAPGGSSSGSAAAVAGGLSDFALGSDTGGSVRVPASFCGLFGMRPTHGVVSTLGMVPHVRSADTVGWFARDARTLRRVGEVLLRDAPAAQPPRRLVIIDDPLVIAQPEVRDALDPALRRVGAMVGAAHHVVLAPQGLDRWRDAYATITGYEAWSSHGQWIEEVRPKFGPAIAPRYQAAARVTREDYNAALRVREDARARLEAVLTPGTVACMPATPFVAPPRERADAPEHRGALLALTCIASLCAVPQLGIPAATIAGCPIGLALIGPRNCDLMLLELAERLDFYVP
ncbi:MAG TPA: amidase [Candidatus Binataceae bacterium]